MALRVLLSFSENGSQGKSFPTVAYFAKIHYEPREFETVTDQQGNYVSGEPLWKATQLTRASPSRPCDENNRCKLLSNGTPSLKPPTPA